MNPTLWLQPPRRSLSLFLAFALGLTVGLVWLGWQVVRLDRNLERQRTQERVGHAIDLVAVSLGRWLDEVDRDLLAASSGVATTASVLTGFDTPETDAPVLLTVTRDRLSDLPAGRLAYYPDHVGVVPHGSGTMSLEPELASAILIDAASLNRSGRYDSALAAYDRLAALPVTVPLLDAPALIVARHARGLIFEALGRGDELRNEASQLRKAIRDSRFQLTRRAYIFYDEKARAWSAQTSGASSVDRTERMRLARAEVASDLATAWRRDPAPASDPITRTVRVGGEPMVVVERRAAHVLTALVAPARLLEVEVRTALGSDGRQIELALLDTNGQPIVGVLPSDVTQRVTRLTDDARLPWTIVAAPGAAWSSDAGAVQRQRLVATGVVMVAVTLLAAAGMVGRSMHRELEAARLQADFVAAVSHEFRTPLAAFAQITELLVDRRVASEADRDEYYRRLQHETGRLRRLVEDLLDFRRMEAGAHEYRFECVEVAPFVRDVVDECQPSGAEHPRLEYLADGQSGFVNADREALARAVRNLIDNALKYAAGTPLVRVVVSQKDEGVSIGVLDTGPGIAPDHQKRIFEKFVRAGAAHAAVHGTGLGLAMVKHIVAAHGGRTCVDSEPGRGSTFTIILPVIAEANTTDADACT